MKNRSSQAKVPVSSRSTAYLHPSLGLLCLCELDCQERDGIRVGLRPSSAADADVIAPSESGPSTSWVAADLAIDPASYLDLAADEIGKLFSGSGPRPIRLIKAHAQLSCWNTSRASTPCKKISATSGSTMSAPLASATLLLR